MYRPKWSLMIYRPCEGEARSNPADYNRIASGFALAMTDRNY